MFDNKLMKKIGTRLSDGRQLESILKKNKGL